MNVNVLTCLRVNGVRISGSELIAMLEGGVMSLWFRNVGLMKGGKRDVESVGEIFGRVEGMKVVCG